MTAAATPRPAGTADPYEVIRPAEPMLSAPLVRPSFPRSAGERPPGRSASWLRMPRDAERPELGSHAERGNQE
jgi:hypothetical protein